MRTHYLLVKFDSKTKNNIKKLVIAYHIRTISVYFKSLCIIIANKLNKLIDTHLRETIDLK